MRIYRFFLLCIGFSLFSGIAFAGDVPALTEKGAKFPVSGFWAFSVNTMLAEGREYVLENGMVLSDLKWPLTPSLSYMLHYGLYFPLGIHLDGNFSIMQTMRTGAMIDKDFEEANAAAAQQGITKLSMHKCDIIDGFRSTIKLGLQLPMPQTTAMRRSGISIVAEPMASLHYSLMSWYSYEGYLQYAKQNQNGGYEPWNKDLPKLPFSGPAVAYRQLLVIPAIGIGFEAALPYMLSLFSDFHVNAGIIASAEDIHYRRDVRFVDIMRGGWAIHGTTRLSWQCLPYLALFFNLFYEYSVTTEGRTLVYNGINSLKPYSHSPPNSAGTALRGCTLSAGFTFLLGR